MAMITVIACVHSGYITVTMTATATAIVQTTLTLRTTVTTVASSRESTLVMIVVWHVKYRAASESIIGRSHQRVTDIIM